MNKCNNCNVYVHCQHKRCPLCGQKCIEQEVQVSDKEHKSPTRYPDYGKVFLLTKAFTVQKLLFFLTIVTVTLSIFINIFTTDSYFAPWSIIVTVSLFVIWSAYRSICSPRLTPGGKLLIIYALICTLLMTIDSCYGFSKWSTTYAIPFLTIALTLIFTLLTIGKKPKFKEYFGYILGTFFLSFIPLILFVSTLATQVWTALIAILYSILTAFGLIIFSDNNFKTEIKKRFHL